MGNKSNKAKIIELRRPRRIINARKIGLKEIERIAEIDDGEPIEFMGMVSAHPTVKRLFSQIVSIANTGLTVLIEGKTGTGKELVANAIHKLSKRADEAFIPVNCGAIPETLAESELFGYEKGAFSGATQNYEGAFGAADKGTIFFDDISELNVLLQAKLLRAFENGEIKKVGASHPHKVDVRVISATNMSLQEMVSKGHFREDLLFRINVLQIFLPPLRERRGDIEPLVWHFIKGFVQEAEEYHIDDSAICKLEYYNWPGNIRELKNVIQRAICGCKNNLITDEDIKLDGASNSNATGLITLGGLSLAKVEEEVVKYELKKNVGNKVQTSKTLGITAATLRAKMKKYGLL